MGSERAALTHHCNVIRRQVLEEFSDLTLLFVVHAPNKKDQAIADAGSNLLAYRDSGKEILEAFKANAKQSQGGFLGLIAGKSKGLIKKRQHFYALFLVNIADYKSMEEAQSGIYHLTWHAIDLYQNYSSGQNNSRYKTENGLISPRHTPLMLSTANFMADVFTALLLALTENDYKQLRKMAVYRAKLALSPSPHYRAELYPYPVAMETAELVYEDLKDTLDPKLKIYHRALQLAQEVGLTHDEQSIKQWWAFSARAQEMAWMEADAQKILNAAIYTSEDPYVKATAYLVAEALNIEPKMFSDAGNYNPFTESEVNERAHNKLCDKIYKDVLARVTGTGDPYYFMEEAQHQNEKLKSGHVSGWCAPALIALEALYKSGNKDWTSAAQETFIAARGAMPWNAMQKLAKGIMKLRRNGQSLTAKAIYEMAKDDPELLAAAQAFEATDGQEFKSAKVEVKKNLRPAAAMPSRHDRDLPPILSHIHGGGETQ